MVNGERYFVAYEGLTNICATCGVYGHLVHNCTKGGREGVAPNVSPHSTPMASNGRVAMQGEDGFTVVSHQRKRQSQQQVRGPMVRESARRGGEDVEKRLTGQPRELAIVDLNVANRFGTLGEEMEILEIEDAEKYSTANKENVKTSSIEIQEMSKVQGKSLQFSATPIHRKNVGREGSKSIGPRAKHGKISKPTYGLVFGQRQEEMALSLSGKRLRVERQAVGRPGGTFVSDHHVISMASNLGKSRSEGLGRICPITAKEGLEKGESMHSDPSEGLTETCIA